MTRRPSFKRHHPYLDEWVLIAPSTGVRPWSGATVDSPPPSLPTFDPDCYLCPGVTRAEGGVNPSYEGVYVFDNDFPTLSPDYTLDPQVPRVPGDEPATGICRVISFTPSHNMTLAVMSPAEVRDVIGVFRDQYAELAAQPAIEHVMIFENKGAVIGVSNPHPHGQLYASDFVPRIPAAQYENASNHLRETGTCLFCSVLEDERVSGSRIVSENDVCTAFVPGFAQHAFEVHIMPRRHVSSIDALTDTELDGLSALYHEMLIRYDNLFRLPFPNITLLRNTPCGTDHNPEPYHFHIEFCPPLRSRDKLKYMAGFETGGGNIINPLLPDEAAALLRDLPAAHYLKDGAE
jgi:UDPglucose--hexose-1-phosphate uridylyltransferase